MEGATELRKLEEANEDEVIGQDPIEIVDPRDEQEEEPAAPADPEPILERIPSAPRRVEIIDCNSLNSLMFHYFAQGDYIECKSLIGEIQSKYSEKNETAFHVRGLIARHEGDLEEAMDCFQKAYETSGKNRKYLYELGRCNFLLGRNQLAVEQLTKASEVMRDNPKVWFWLAKAIYHFPAEKMAQGKSFNPVEAARTVLMKPDIARDSTLVTFLGKLCNELGDTDGAIAAYEMALKMQPDNTEVMNLLGLTFLRIGKVQEGFVQLGNCLAYDPANSQAILTIGSIMQNHLDHDVALNKYRVAADVCDYNGCLWNNIGIGLMARNKPAASHSALKKAAFIHPLDFKISYNLGVLHDLMNLRCSALHYMKLSTDLKPNNSKAVGAMAVILSHMGDNKNAKLAYRKSIELKPVPSVVLNYAIFEYRQKDYSSAWKALSIYNELHAAGVKCTQGNQQTAGLLATVLKDFPHDEPSAEAT